VACCLHMTGKLLTRHPLRATVERVRSRELTLHQMGAGSNGALDQVALNVPELVRHEPIKRVRDEGSIGHNTTTAHIILSELPDDIILNVVEATHGDALHRLRLIYTLAGVCRRFRIGVSRTTSLFAEAAARELVGREGCCVQLEQGLLNMSSQNIGRLEASLLARALSCGMLQGPTTLWLQNNAIDAKGLRALARGLRAMPRVPTIRSMSLGANVFHAALQRDSEECDATLCALEDIKAAAATRGIKLRLHT